jgi:DNA-binding GntR family transcriptional regulator
LSSPPRATKDAAEDADGGVATSRERGELSLGDEVTARLRDEILGGGLAPGTRLIERAIAARLGVSRSPVREALHRLEEERLAKTLPSGGAYVTVMTSNEVRDIYRVRAALERCVGLSVAGTVTEEHLDELRSIVDRMAAAAAAGDVDAQVGADADFHQCLWRLSGNARLQEVLTTIHSQILRVVRLSISNTPSEQAVQDHIFLIHALERGSAGVVAIAMEQHVLAAGEHAIDALRRETGAALPVQTEPGDSYARRVNAENRTEADKGDDAAAAPRQASTHTGIGG